MDKMVEIARFTYPSEARTLMALLESEDIPCYLRNELTTQLMAGYVDVGGARVEILESDVERAMQVMEEGGYLIPGEEEEAEQLPQVTNWTRHIPFLKNAPLEKQIIGFLILLAILLGLIIALGWHFSIQ